MSSNYNDFKHFENKNFKDKNSMDIEKGFKFTDDWKYESTKNDNQEDKDDQFLSYSHFGIHNEMISDSVRTETYRKSMMNNPYIFKDKIVLDVGAGTGLLSIFAANSGAKLVIAVEYSAMAIQAKQIIEDNKLDNKILVIREKMEDIEDLPQGIKKVDIIISEWMG